MLSLIVMLVVMFGILYVYMNRGIRARCKGKTEQQKRVIKYIYGGCLTFGGMNDAEYDQTVASMCNKEQFFQQALSKIGLDEDQLREIPPVFLEGYASNNTFVGKQDGRLRSTWYETAWLLFSDTQVYMYKYCWDMESDGKRESCEEYFYSDVTNFTTSAETVEAFNVKHGCFGLGKEKLEKVNRETSNFSLVVPGGKFNCSTSNVPDAETSVGAMKQKLREKKNVN